MVLDKAYNEAASQLDDDEQKLAEELRVRTVELITPTTLPATSMLEWARKYAILPTTVYETPSQIIEVVAEAIVTIADEIRNLAAYNPFWDIQYNSGKIINRTPKHETDIHPTIRLLLHQLSVAKNLQIVPEYPIAGGRLDFLVTGSLQTGERVSVGIEFKPAHSTDIEHGLLTQLPAYMKAEGTNFGIYCVLYFKGKHYEHPQNYDADSLYTELTKLRLKAGLHNIRVEILDVSHQESPSKL